MLAPSLGALACILAYMPLKPRYESFLSARFDALAKDFLLAMPMAVPTILALLLLIPVARWTERKFGLSCPHCQKALAPFKAIVIASRNCPHCGARVIEDEC